MLKLEFTLDLRRQKNIGQKKLVKQKRMRLWTSRAVVRASLEREVQVSNLGLVKTNKVLPRVRHRCDISSKGAVVPAGAMKRRWALQTFYTLRRNTASKMKD